MCLCACTYVRVCACVCVCVCMYVCMYVCMHYNVDTGVICTCVHVHIKRHADALIAYVAKKYIVCAAAK